MNEFVRACLILEEIESCHETKYVQWLLLFIFPYWRFTVHINTFQKSCGRESSWLCWTQGWQVATSCLCFESEGCPVSWTTRTDTTSSLNVQLLAFCALSPCHPCINPCLQGDEALHWSSRGMLGSRRLLRWDVGRAVTVQNPTH